MKTAAEDEEAALDLESRPRRRLSPQLKKSLAYQKERRPVNEIPHRERRDWPKRKALRNQQYRGNVRRAIQAALRDHTPDAGGDLDVLPVRRLTARRRRNIRPVPLREWIDAKRVNRAANTARSFFRSPYDRWRHAAHFAAFLASVTAGRWGRSPGLMREFRLLLLLWVAHRTRWWTREDHDWFGAFVRDEPAWRVRLEGWCAWDEP